MKGSTHIVICKILGKSQRDIAVFVLCPFTRIRHATMNKQHTYVVRCTYTLYPQWTKRMWSIYCKNTNYTQTHSSQHRHTRIRIYKTYRRMHHFRNKKEKKKNRTHFFVWCQKDIKEWNAKRTTNKICMHSTDLSIRFDAFHIRVLSCVADITRIFLLLPFPYFILLFSFRLAFESEPHSIFDRRSHHSIYCASHGLIL